MALICIHNATVVSGYAQMPDSAVLIDGDRIADVFRSGALSKSTLALLT